MNTRASQIERPKSAESFSDGTSSVSSRPDWSVDPSSAISDPDQTQGELLDSVYDVGKGVQANAESPKVERASQALPQSVWSRIPFCLIGMLLSATALAKLWMLLTDSFADIRVGLPKEILWLSVAFEFWLAYENFRLRDDRVMAFVNTLVFASFAIFAGIRLALGYASCGCSGNLEIPAWVFVLIDVGIVFSFLVFSSQRSRVVGGFLKIQFEWASYSFDKQGRFAGLFLFAGLLVSTQLPFAQPLRNLIFAAPLIAATVEIDGELTVNHETLGQFEVWNHSAHPARVIGVSRSCRCVSLPQSPVGITIDGGRRAMIPIAIKPFKAGSFHQRIELYLQHPKQVRVRLDVVGSVKKGKKK